MSAATSITLPSRESILEARERVARWLEANAAGGRLVLSCGRVVVTPTVARGPRGRPIAGVGAKKAISNPVYETDVAHRDPSRTLDEILVAAKVAFSTIVGDPRYLFDLVIFSLALGAPDGPRRVTFTLHLPEAPTS